MANGNEGVMSLDKVRRNPWILATVILALALIVLLVMKSGFIGGGAVSADTAAEKLLSYINAQGGTAEVVSAEKNGSFYEVVVRYQGQDVPVYVTLDGDYLVPGLIPLTASAAAGTGSKTDSTPTEVPQTAKPVVELFVMALCPYGTQIEKGIIPVAELFGSKIDFKIKFVSYAMHGKTEIDENTRQYCIEKEQSSKFIPYLKCYLGAGKSDECLTSSGIDKTKLASCVAAADKQFNITANFDNKDSWLNGNYPMYNVNKAECDKYEVQGSPTLVVNGVQVSSARDPASLAKAICAAFTTAPDACKNNTLSSSAPSAGFGYAAASGTTGSATCG